MEVEKYTLHTDILLISSHRTHTACVSQSVSGCFTMLKGQMETIRLLQSGAGPVGPRTELEISRTVKRFAQSLSNLHDIQGVLRAKSKFLTLRSGGHQEDVEDGGEDLGDLAEREWERIAASSLSFKIAGFDFSQLESIDKFEPLSSPLLSSPPPPPPPPPPPTRGPSLPPPPPPPPPPPTSPPPAPPAPGAPGADSVDSFSNPVRKVSRQQTASPGPPPRMSKLHWKSVRGGAETIWSELPPVCPDLSDLQTLFSVHTKTSLSSPPALSLAKKHSVVKMKTDRLRDVAIIMKGLPQEGRLTDAIRDMDEDVIDRDQIDKLIKLLTFIDEIDQLKKFAKENPGGSLDPAERFLLSLASIPNIEAKLGFWSFRLDCEASEEELCRPVHDLNQAMELLRENKQFKLMLSLILSSGNYLNQTTIKAFCLTDLQKVSMMKDKTKEKTLLYHVVRKALEEDPDFDGFDETFVSVFEAASRTDLEQVTRDLEVMEDECKKSLRFALKTQNVDLMHFIREVVERVITLTKIIANLQVKFNQFIQWLGFDLAEKQKENEFCKIISDFSLETNVIVKTFEKESKKKDVQRNKQKQQNVQQELKTIFRKDLRKVSNDEPDFKPSPLVDEVRVLDNDHDDTKADVDPKNEDELFKVLVSGFKERKTIRRRNRRRQ